jgi:hypothetical protein
MYRYLNSAADARTCLDWPERTTSTTAKSRTPRPTNVSLFIHLIYPCLPPLADTYTPQPTLAHALNSPNSVEYTINLRTPRPIHYLLSNSFILILPPPCRYQTVRWGFTLMLFRLYADRGYGSFPPCRYLHPVADARARVDGPEQRPEQPN